MHENRLVPLNTKPDKPVNQRLSKVAVLFEVKPGNVYRNRVETPRYSYNSPVSIELNDSVCLREIQRSSLHFLVSCPNCHDSQVTHTHSSCVLFPLHLDCSSCGSRGGVNRRPAHSDPTCCLTITGERLKLPH